MGFRTKQETADFVAMLDATEKRLDRDAQWSWELSRAEYQTKLIQSVTVTGDWVKIEYEARSISFPKDQAVYSVTEYAEESQLLFGHAVKCESMKIMKGVRAVEILDRIMWALKKPETYEFPIELLDQTNPFAGEWKR